MTEKMTRTKVLITVMTYPHPSKSYDELVCTAGITDKGEWVRLYPVDYRYQPDINNFTNTNGSKWIWLQEARAMTTVRRVVSRIWTP